MKPTKYTKKGSTINYHYTFKQLRGFLEHGFKEGDNGFILIGQDDKFLKYRGFGTIASPCKSLRTIDIENDPIFDGKMPDPEKVIGRYIAGCDPYDKSATSYSFVVWDTKENKLL